MRFIVFLCLISLLFGSCAKDKQDSPDVGYSYFPLAEGQEKVYSVDSIVYDNNSGHTTIDTFEYYYKEVVGSAFRDDAGQASYTITRYFTDSLQHPWVTAGTRVASVNEFYAEQVEDNARLVKLAFPVKAGKSWNGNLYNNQAEQTFTIDETGTTVEIGQGVSKETIRVMEQEDINAIEEIVRYERYAKDLGMYYLLRDSINTQSIGSRGYRYRLKLLNTY